MQDNISKLYGVLKDTYEVGSEDDFRQYLSDSDNREALRKELADEYEVGDSAAFNRYLGFDEPSDVNPYNGDFSMRESEIAGRPDGEASGTVGATSANPKSRARQPQAHPVNIPSLQEVMDKRPQYQPQPILEKEVVTDAKGNRVRRPKLQPTFAGGRMQEIPVVRDVMGNEYDPTDESVQEEVRRQTRYDMPNVKQANREQVASLSQEVDDRLSALTENVRKQTDPTNYMRYTIATGGKTLETVSPGYKELQSARRSLRDAQRIIDEADHNAQSGTFGKWMESSFAGGVVRGFGQKLFDVETWDMGESDLSDAGALMKALNDADSGKPLTEEQRLMLDAKAVEMATNAYFGSYVGRGYEAGKVTGESLPFMLEMMINPASTLGISAQSKLARYALKRFSKKIGIKAAEEMTEKGLMREAINVAGKKAVKKAVLPYSIGGRVIGDVGASAILTSTTGIGGVSADAINRMNGQVEYVPDMEGKSVFAGVSNQKEFGTALKEAFLSRTIENHSEMLGEYFAPVLGVVGKGVGKGLSKIGLDGVNKFVDNIAASDLARLVTDFEKRAKWSGTIGEYAEEVVGGIENAILVGDQTLDTDKDTGVFNLDNNINTFLGVSLLGGVISSVKTIGYKSSKYRMRREMENADKFASSIFANQDKWEQIRSTIAEGIGEDIKAVLAEVRNDDSLTQDKKIAAFKYAQFAMQYRGALIADEKRHSEAPNSIQTDVETSFDNGYTLEGQEKNDAKNWLELQQQRIGEIADDNMMQKLREKPMEALDFIRTNPELTDEERQTALDYVNAKATYDGMLQRVADDVDGRIAESDRLISERRSKTDGMIHPAVLKAENKQVYIVDGNVMMMPDGSMVDSDNSDESVIVRDAETGELSFVSPHDILSVDESIDADEEMQAARQAIRQEFAQQAADEIEGVLPFNYGDVYDVIDAEGQQHTIEVVPYPDADAAGAVPEGSVLVSVDGAYVPQLMSRNEIQNMADAYNLTRLAEYEQTKAAHTVEQAEENGLNVQDGQSESDVAPVDDAMPMIGEGENAEPDFLATTPERAHSYLYNEAGLSRDEANQFVEANKKAADKALEKAKKGKPIMGTSLAKYKKEQSEYQQKVDAAQQVADYWQAVKEAQQRVLSAELDARAAEDAANIAQAQQEEQLRQEEELRKLAAQAALGTNNVAPAIREKWDAAPKVEGARNEIVLANGERVPGKYVLVESGAATPSHNPIAEFAKNEGFPVDENGQSVNDRDYERDKDAQTTTRQIAANYDQRALQSPVVATNDGVVLSGNGRTMAGELAARDNTDGAYIEHLKQYGSQFGFAPDQVEGMQHPRVLFVPDAPMSYTADTFAKFNQQEMKGQSKTEQAVKLGKIIDDEIFRRIVRMMNLYDTLGEFYNDTKAATQAINELRNAGAISAAQYTEMFDGDAISAQGREILENMLIGKAFESNPDAVREITAIRSMRQSIITALSEISNNIMLGEGYSLESELSQAIGLVYKARKEGGYKAGDRVNGYARQGNLFAFDEGETVADYTNAAVMMLADVINDNRTTRLKKWFSVYNSNAAESAKGQMDLFTGDVATKQEIINQVNILLSNGTDEEIKQQLDTAAEQRRTESVQQDGTDGNGNGSNDVATGQGDLAQTEAIELSDEVDENGRQFVLTSDGNIEFGRIEAETGLTPAPILLSEGIITNPDTNDGYGLVHIEARHGNEIRKAGYNSVVDFIEEVAKNYEVIREGNTRDGIQTYMLQLTDKHNNTLMVELSGDGTYWNINTAGIFKTSYGAKRNVVYNRHTTDKQPAETAEASLSGEQSGTTPSTSMSAPTQTSADKGTEISANEQGNEKKNAIAAAEAEVNTNPTEAQKEAGNYKKGHITIDGYDVTIENPKGSERSGTDASGKQWRQTMHNTYGYIRGTEGVDGDHIDVFLSDNPEEGDVYVIDQVNKDGSFDEHKVMYGFNSAEEASAAYLYNYEEGWQGLGTITGVTKDEFKKWVESSHRKTKPFADYKSVKAVEGQSAAPYSIEPTTYTNKKGKETPMFLVKFGSDLTKEQIRAGKELAKNSRGWWDIEHGGFMMRSEDAANELAEALGNAEAVTDAQPMSLQDMSMATEQTEAEQEEVSTESQQTEQPKRLVSDERMEELKARLRKKMFGQLNMGVDPEILAIGAELAVGHIERGLTKFADYAKTMIEDLGDAIRPYLKAFYNAVRDMPEAEEYAEQMDSYDDVRKFDLLSVRPEGETSDTTAGILERAEEVAKEQEAEEQAEVAKGKLTEQRNDGRKVQSEGVALDGTPLRAITEKDLDNRDAKFYHQGKRVYIFAVMRSGEQVSATQFSEPHLDNIYLTNGQSIKPEELMVADETKEPVGNDDVQKILDIAKKGKKTSKSKKKDVTLQSPSFMGDLFNENTEDNGHERTDDAVRTEGLPADGTDSGERSLRANGKEAGQESGRTDRRGTQEGVEPVRQRLYDGLRPSDQLNNTAPAQKRRTQQPLERPATPKNLRNNHAERGKNYAPKGVDARIDANIKAIELMKQLIESGEQATPEQMAVLRQFSGWGGLGKAFENFTAYTNGKPTPQYLRELLGEEAYQQANMSRNSAYYTPANVIDAMWDVAKAMGFQGGNVLEGSAGIGDIIGHMPTDISERSDIHAVEIDQTTGSILSLLYPDAKVDVQGFEATQVENGSVDLAITNVPFVTGLRVNDTTGDKDLSKKFHDIHDFCIAKNVRKLREGGIGIFITSSGTLDNSAKLREWIIQEGGADVVGAFRMHNETFGGTGATSDIIVVRKRVNGMKSQHAIDVLSTTGERTADYDTGETKRVKGEEIPVIKHMSMDYNSYFVEHPEMMAGEMRFGFEMGDTFRPTSKALYPVSGKNQDEMLKAWAESFAEKEWEAIPDREPSGTVAGGVYEDLGADVKEGSMVLSGGELCIAQRGKTVPLGLNPNKVKGHTKAECFEAYQSIKKALADLLQYQTENENDSGLKPLLQALNKAYDSFVKTYGHLHKNTAISFLKNDVDFANIVALESFTELGDGKGGVTREYGKTDIFSQRVVDKEKAPEPKDVKDGIIASIYVHGRIDLPWIVDKLNAVNGQHTEESVRAEIIASGLGFENPATRQMEVSYEYLSGNVREKLAQAQANNSDGQYDANIKALEAVIPMDIPAHLIDFSIGSSWIDPKLYEEYVKEKTDIDVKFTTAGGTWFMKTPYYVAEQKNRAMGVVSEMLHKTIMGTQLIEAAMQNKTITVSETHKKWDGSTETITDKEATQACSNKIDEIRQDFKDWARAKMQSDPTMSEHIERIYNEMFNNYVPKGIPDEFVPAHFGGAATMVDGKEFALRPHQAKAAIRGTTQPLLLAHEVGSGKTYTLITTAMEMRRLGTARKPMIVVQNATVGQFVESAKKLYPNAKVLTLEDKDHTGEGRRNFYAKIKYNDWDMIVVPQSVFERIPDSEERQMKFVQDKIEEKLLVLEQMKDSDPQGQSMIVRQAEKEIDSLKDELAGLTDTISTKRKERDEKKRAVTMQNAEVKALEMLNRQTDDVENFDDMGIDALLVDEAHEYKHLGFATAMQRGVKGVDPSYSKKAQGVYLKTQAVLEKNNGRNVIFATGTPISNTAAEIWTFMRYLMPSDTMKEYGIFYFDDFVRNFGNLTQMLEFTTSGKFKENNRFAGYINLPELVRIWSGVADTVLNKDIEAQRIAEGKESKIPDMEDGKATDIYLPQTRALRSIMKFVKKRLDEYEKMSGKEKKENSHIPLTMYGIAKAAAVDARLVMSDAEDDPNSKTNGAVRQILKSLSEADSYKGTVAVFADNYQNKKSGFNLYEDIREKLIAQGVPAEQIVVMKSGMSVKKKLEIFDKVNRGDVRVIMGSTFTLGTGVNIQERLHTLIHLDAPNRPMDYTQRNGRILRQGNLHKDMSKPVRVLRFGVEDSLDVTAYQRLKTKGAIADSIMNGKQMMANSMENRALEEEEDVFGDTVAQLSGSEYAMLKNQAEKDVRKYEAKKKQYEADQTYCHNEIPRLEGEIKMWKEWLEKNRANLAKTESLPTEKTITVGKQTFASIDAMSDFIKEYNKTIKEVENDLRDNPSLHSETRRLTVNVGGIDFVFTIEQSIETKQEQGTLFSAVHRKMTYSCEALGLKDEPVYKSLLREGLEHIIENIISGKEFKERIERGERNLDRCEKSLAQIRERFGKPFEYSKELATAHERLYEYAELMKKELEEKEKKYAEMDADVDEAIDITEAEEAEEEDEDDDDSKLYRMREEEPPVRTGIGYKVFVLKDGKLYPPMVANPNGEDTPVGVWLDADAAPVAGTTKTGRQQVKSGGKGTQGGSGMLAYRPGWHLGEIPYALQFGRLNPETGKRELFPANFVWAEVEYANDVDYQQEAHDAGINSNGKYQHSLAGLPYMPENGSYKYRTNPNPETDPWIITGAMKVKRILKPSEVDELVKAAGREPQQREVGAVTDEQVEALNKEIKVQENKRRFDELKEKYNGKPVQFIRLDNVGDEDFFRAIGATEEDIAEMSVEEMHEQAKQLKKLFKSRHSIGGYSRLNRKITIFADRIPLHKIEEFFFHENIHGILHDWYEDELRGIAERFYDVAPKKGGLVEKSFIENGYKDKTDAQKKEEFFVYWLSKAMVEGRTQEILDMLDWEDSERIENILKSLGYERGREESERRKGEEDSEDSEETHGQFLPSLSGGRRNGESTIGYDRRTGEASRRAEEAQDEAQRNLGQNVSGQLLGREGQGGVSYEESLASSRAAGYTKRQHEAYWRRTQRNMRFAADYTIGKLGLGGRVTVMESTEGLKGRKAKAKGWYDERTGQIVVILGNHGSVGDLIKTILHEGVAHYGLRRLFGSNFNHFLDNVFDNADKGVRGKIVELSKKHDWDFRTATEEYLASLAEDTEFERAESQGWWHEIRELFMLMLDKLGLLSYIGRIGDNELRYILWRSYKELSEPGSYRNPFRQAEDIDTQMKLGVGNYARKENVDNEHDELYVVADTTEQANGIGIKIDDRISQKNYLLSDNYVSSLTGEEFAKNEEPLTGRVAEFYAKNYGGKVEREGVGVVILDERSVKDSIAHGIGRNKAVAFAAVPNIISEGAIIDRKENWKGRGYGSVTFAAPVKIGNEGYVGIVIANEVTRSDGSHRFYLHEVALQKNLLSEEFKTGIDTGSKQGDVAKILKEIVTAKEKGENFSGDDGKLYRDGDSDGTKEAYNEAVNTGKKGTLRMTSFNFREAFQDSMLALKKLQEIVEKKFGVKLESFEDAYKYENTLGSLNMRQQEKFYKDYFTPMIKIADKIVAKEGANVKELNEYLICKHGLERNRVFAERDFEKYKKEHPDGEKTLDDFRKRDYSGLTEITGKEGIEEIEAEAERIVQEFEAKHGESCAKLWEAINAATKETLAHGFKCGMMSKATYEKVRDMFKYYVPLRGWDADTAEDVYDYVRGDYGGAFNATLKAAKGRTTTSDDVLATIGNMGYSSILQGNRNNMKIRLFNMASRYPTGVCSVRDMWLVENAWGEWVSNFPAIPEDATPEQVADILETHEVEMSALEKQGKAKRQRNALDIGFHIDKKNIPEHAVVAYIGGKPNIVYINGNPRAAQAVNGKTGNALPGNNPLARLVDFIFKDTKRYYSSMLTTYRPTFAVSNFARDLGHSIAMTYVDKGLIDMAKYIANLPVSMAYVIKGQSGFKAGDSKMSTYFREFLDNGGMTGYAHLEDVEQWKAKNNRRWARMNALQKAGYAPVEAIGGLMDAISWLSETLELIPRFNTYVAERRDGKDIITSVKAAKDITVNFNKKGSEVTPGVWGAVANTLRYEKMFFNPIVQSLEQYYRLGKKHPVRMAVATLHLPILGAIMPYVNMMLVEAFAGGDGDDDKDKYDYWLQNEYTRRNNILIFTGNGYIKIPIAQGFREFYGMGEAIATRHFGKCDDFELAYSLAEQIRTMFSVEGQTNYKQWSLLRFIMPEQYGTAADIANNENFMGGTLWYENMYKEHLPEYKKAKPSTWSPLVSISKQLNEWIGYDDDVAGDMSGRWMNPAAWQHVIQNYGGGVAEMVGDIASMVIDKGDDKETDSSQWPIAKRFYTKATEERANWAHYGMYKDFEDDYKFAKEKVSALNKKDITKEERDRQFADFAKIHPKAAAIYSAWDDGELMKDIKKAEFGSEEFWELINEAVDAAEKAVYKPWNQQERQQ